MSNLLSNFGRWKAIPIAFVLLATSPYTTQAVVLEQSSAVVGIFTPKPVSAPYYNVTL